MTAEELHLLRRRLRLTQAQFAECLGVSKDLVKSVETGRRRLTERWEQEIGRIFGGVRLSVQGSALVPATSQQEVFCSGNLRQRRTFAEGVID